MKKHYSKVIAFVCVLLMYACADGNKQKENTSETTDKTKEKPEITQKTTTNTTPAFGIDISQYQGDEVEALTQYEDNIQFIFCKATEGVTYVDPKFTSNWTAIKEKGFIRGAYHFYRSADDPTQQAEFFIQTLGELASMDIPPVVDFEKGGIDKSQAVEDVQESILTMLQVLEEKIQITPILYTDNYTANEYLNNETFGKYPLWIADYESKETPVVPSAWEGKGYTFWQKSDNYQIKNFTDDADVFNGDVNALKEFIKKSHK
jgi:lysozyme